MNEIEIIQITDLHLNANKFHITHDINPYNSAKIIIDEVIKVHFNRVAQMNVPGVAWVIPNQAVVYLNDIVDGVVEHGPVISAGRFVSAKGIHRLDERNLCEMHVLHFQEC